MIRNTSGGGPNAQRTLVQLDVVELAPMEQKMVVLEAAALQRDLAAQGRVALYGVLFDTDSDVMRPDSQPQLEEIAKLLRDTPQLKVLIVGHTDTRGSLTHNQDAPTKAGRSTGGWSWWRLVGDRTVLQAKQSVAASDAMQKRRSRVDCLDDLLTI